MRIEPLDPARKVAIVLLSLDQGVAADLLGRMPRDLVERVTLAIANAGRVTRDEQESVLSDFKSSFAARPLMHPTGPETARELLERTLDQNEVEPIQQRMEEQVQAGPFAFLHLRHADDIRMLIQLEHPQTIAVIVAQLPPALSSRVLSGFAPADQAEILNRLATIGPTDAESLEEISTTLQNRIGKMPVRTGGVVQASEVLRETPGPSSHDILKFIGQKNSHVADSIRQSLFSFAELFDLTDETLTVVLEETAQLPWAVALKGCADKLRQRILRQVGSKAGKALQGEINVVGPLRLSEITGAQNQIVTAILDLESKGRIELPKQETKPPRDKGKLSRVG